MWKCVTGNVLIMFHEMYKYFLVQWARANQATPVWVLFFCPCVYPNLIQLESYSRQRPLRGNWVFRITLFLKSVFYKFFFYSSLYTFFLNFSILLYLFLLSIFFISLLLFYKNGHSRPLFLSFLLKLQLSLTLSWLKNSLSSGCLPIKQHRFESCLN